MFRQYPRQQTRIVLNRFIRTWLETIRAAYFPNTPFMASVEFFFISNAIMLAHVLGERLNVSQLADRVEMPRKTLSDRLKRMEDKGYTSREDGYVIVPESRFIAAQTNGTLDRLIDAVIETGKELERLREKGEI